MEMINVKVDEINGVLVTTSNRVAEELGVQHRSLVSKIDDYVKKFQSAKLSADFYIPSNYKDNRNRTYRNYLITKKGIAQLVGGYSSAVERAFELNVAYINKFDEMEKMIYSGKQLPINYDMAIPQKKSNYYIPTYEERVESTRRMVEKLSKEMEVELKKIHESLVAIKGCEACIKLYMLQI